MKIKLLVQILLSSFILSTLAAVPSEINYQGLITNSDGDPIESATNSVAVNLYQVETGGTSVYTQSFTQVASDANGIYSIQIGGASLQSVLEANNELWLELIINEETLSPRQEINSVPYALVAKSAESIVPGSDADAAITSLQASDASRPSQAPVLLAIGWNYPSLSSVYVGYHDDVLGQPAVAEVGDRILITEQSNASENGIYEVESLNGNFASLVRAEDYNSAEEINAGDFVFVQKGDNAGQGYLVGTVSESFELGVDNLNFSRFTIDTTLPVVFDSRIEAQELRVVGPGGSVYFNGTINSISSLYVTDEMLVPTPVYGSEATNKSYVDAVVAANTSVIATETSARATAITALQADVDQNESDADAAIAAEASTARAAEQANADNIFSNTTDISNNAVNISNNSTDIATNSTNIITNTGSVTTNTTNITLNATAITAEVTRAEAAEAALQADIDQNESDADAAITAEATTARTAEQAIATAISVEATRAEAAEAALQADVDQNESDANAAIASLQASDASQAPVLLAIEWSPMSLSYVMVGYHDTALGQPAVAAAGDRILMVGQASASENGIYEVDGLDGNFASLVRADDYNSAEEINAGDFVFVQKGDNAGQGYILEALPENFELGADNLNFSRFTINTTRPVVFDSRIEAQELRVLGPGGSVNFDGSNNYINGNLSVDGYRADFEDVDEMLVPTPDQDNEATNKAYVDAAVATNTSAIATETSARATAITALQADVDQNESDADAAIATEASTARAAEQANADDIFSNTTDISNNAVNISNHSTDIANNTANISTNTGNISTNTGNVTTNTTNITSNAAAITSEVARAEAVESALATAITAEASRAEAAEAALQADIDQNESDADAAIAALQGVDASSARQFVVDFGFMDNKSNLNSVYINLELTDYSGYYSCEVGDTVLLTGQADSSENGIYEITNASGQIWSKTISLTRSSSYDTAEELNEGDLVLIEKGESNGLAFMLGAVPEAFVLGNDALTWYRCGINTNQDIEFTGVVTVGELRTYPQHSWETELRLGQSSNYFDVNSGTFEFRGNNGSRVDFRDYIEVNFQNYGGVDFDTDVEFTSTVTVPTPTEDNEVANKAYVDTAVATNTTALDAETSARATAITALQTDVDQNEAGADAAIAAEASTSRAAEQANASAIQTNATAISDEASTARAAEQANADAIFSNTTDISNNTTDIVNNASAIAAEATTARAAEQANATAITTLQSDVNQNESDADTAIADIKTGDTVFSGSPSFTGVKALPSGQTDYTSNYYELQPWNTPSSVVPNYATVNVDGLLNADVINAERMLRVGNLYITENEFISDYGQVNISNLRTFDLEIDGDLMFDGYRADFAMASEVRVPTPDQDFEAANKAYVDAVVVPSGGLIAWPSANDMPDGWSNAMLSSPMNNYIWIRKD